MPRFIPGNEFRYPLYRRVGGPHGRSERVRKISSEPGFDPQDLPARSESLYRLCYASPPINHQQNSIPRPPPCKRCYNGRSMEVRKHVHVMSSAKVLASTDYIRYRTFHTEKLAFSTHYHLACGKTGNRVHQIMRLEKTSLAALHFERKCCRQLHLIRYAQLMRCKNLHCLSTDY
jgi:hypothetical protein